KVWEAMPLPLEIYRQREHTARVFDLVESLFSTRVRRADVIDCLRGDTRLNEALRQAALDLAGQYRQDPVALCGTSRIMGRTPNGSSAAYHRALLQAEEACRLEPTNALHVNTLGLAQYRLGQYQEALETLARSEKLQATSAGGSLPADLAFRAMAQYQLGQ